MKRRLTVLSFGGGQDSTAIWWRLVRDAAFREKYAPGRLVVVMSDTGDEHPDTYVHVQNLMDRSGSLGLEFWFLSADMGFHSPSWSTLMGHYRRNNICGCRLHKKSCTDGLKIQPIYKWLDWWIGEQYGYESGMKRAMKAFVADNGKIDVLIGLARGEERRLAKTADDGQGLAVWFHTCIRRRYPLMDEKMDRADCQAYVRSLGEAVPPPSNCVRCPFKDKMELLWTFRNLPDEWAEWVVLEEAKLAKFAHLGEKNLGVHGRTPLPLVLAEAQEQYGHMSDEELEEYRFSHGHCVASSY